MGNRLNGGYLPLPAPIKYLNKYKPPAKKIAPKIVGAIKPIFWTSTPKSVPLPFITAKQAKINKAIPATVKMVAKTFTIPIVFKI